jgi:hypothetical protein
MTLCLAIMSDIVDMRLHYVINKTGMRQICSMDSQSRQHVTIWTCQVFTPALLQMGSGLLGVDYAPGRAGGAIELCYESQPPPFSPPFKFLHQTDRPPFSCSNLPVLASKTLASSFDLFDPNF